MIVKFTKNQIAMMTQLGYDTDFKQEMCYEGWEESSCECRANGIPSSTFNQYLQRQIAWQKMVDSAVV